MQRHVAGCGSSPESKDQLETDPGLLEDVVHARRPERLPIVLNRQELQSLHAVITCLPRIANTITTPPTLNGELIMEINK